MQHSSNGLSDYQDQQRARDESFTSLTLAIHAEHHTAKRHLGRISLMLDKVQGLISDINKEGSDISKTPVGLLNELKEESYAAASIAHELEKLANRLEVVIGGTISQAQGTTGGEDLSFRRH